jgi:hypothetical protein
MPETTQKPNPFTDTSPSRQQVFDAVGDLPLRAMVVVAYRCAKRVEPLRRHWELLPDAYSAGVPLLPYPEFGSRASATAVNAAFAALLASDSFVGCTREAVHEAVADACAAAALAARSDDITAAVFADIATLRALKLGKPGEPGEPIRWNDSRLGPLWPNGEPEWYTKAVQVCCELEEQLRDLPDPNAPPDDPAFVAHAMEYLKAEQWYNEGKFDEYRGEYVFFSDGIIFGHGRNLADLRPIAEEKAAAAGIPPERLVDYFVPGE